MRRHNYSLPAKGLTWTLAVATAFSSVPSVPVHAEEGTPSVFIVTEFPEYKKLEDGTYADEEIKKKYADLKSEVGTDQSNLGLPETITLNGYLEEEGPEFPTEYELLNLDWKLKPGTYELYSADLPAGNYTFIPDFEPYTSPDVADGAILFDEIRLSEGVTLPELTVVLEDKTTEPPSEMSAETESTEQTDTTPEPPAPIETEFTDQADTAPEPPAPIETEFTTVDTEPTTEPSSNTATDDTIIGDGNLDSENSSEGNTDTETIFDNIDDSILGDDSDNTIYIDDESETTASTTELITEVTTEPTTPAADEGSDDATTPLMSEGSSETTTTEGNEGSNENTPPAADEGSDDATIPPMSEGSSETTTTEESEGSSENTPPAADEGSDDATTLPMSDGSSETTNTEGSDRSDDATTLPMSDGSSETTNTEGSEGSDDNTAADSNNASTPQAADITVSLLIKDLTGGTKIPYTNESDINEVTLKVAPDEGDNTISFEVPCNYPLTNLELTLTNTATTEILTVTSPAGVLDFSDKAPKTLVLTDALGNTYNLKLTLKNKKHTFAPATCTIPQTCTVCGATEGGTIDHDFSPATCIKLATCKVCGLPTGEYANHTSTKKATCTEPEICSVCNEEISKELGHDYKAETCTTPKTCERCGATKGKPRGHDMQDDWLIEKESTDSEHGLDIRYCNRKACDYSETRPRNIIGAAERNIITNITEGANYKLKTAISFTAGGSGMANAKPIDGDVRFVPSSWKVQNTPGEFKDNFSGAFSVSIAGNYTLTVNFQKQIYQGGEWKNTDTIDSKAVNFSVGQIIQGTPVNGSEDGIRINPQTGDTSPIISLVILLVVAVIAVVGVVIYQKKKK